MVIGQLKILLFQYGAMAKKQDQWNRNVRFKRQLPRAKCKIFFKQWGVE
jgi:hypothetical protein